MGGFNAIFLFALAVVGVKAASVEEAIAVDGVVVPRQAPGTPLYECHSDCGNALTGSRIANHCDNSTWVGLYEDCLDCALQFNIWRHYGARLGDAGSACGLSSTPAPSGESSGPSSSSESPVASSEPVAPTSSIATTTPSSTSGPESGAAATGTGLPPSFTDSGSASTTSPVVGHAAGIKAPASMLLGSLFAIAIGVAAV